MAINSAATAGKGTPQPTLTVTTETANPWGQVRLLILAAAGEGKTHLGLTASKHYGAGPAALDDILFVEGDPGGLVCAQEKGYTVPTIDLATLSDDALFSLWGRLGDTILSYVKEHGTRCVIIDSLSSVMENMLSSMQQRDDGPKLYNDLAAGARTLLRKLNTMPCPLVLTAHIKPPKMLFAPKSGPLNINELKETRELQAVAAGTEGVLSMMMPGEKVASVIRNAIPNIAHLQVAAMPGGKYERKLNFESDTVEGKRRLSSCVNKTEPAHLNELFARIAAGLGIPPL